jgi:phytoene dehydrogenase-like protein
MAHPVLTGETAVLARSLDVTADALGVDARAYRRLFEPLSERWQELAPDLLRAPLLSPPRHPALLARFGLLAAMPAAVLARTFRGPRARGLFAGLAGHVMAPLSALRAGCARGRLAVPAGRVPGAVRRARGVPAGTRG